METLHDNEYARIEWDASRSLLTFRRTRKPFASLRDALAEMETLRTQAERVGLRTSAILVDSREAPLRADPEFEALSEKHFLPLVKRFRRAAVLIASATGRLQVGRIRREQSAGYEVFDEVGAALAFLASEGRA